MRNLWNSPLSSPVETAMFNFFVCFCISTSPSSQWWRKTSIKRKREEQTFYVICLVFSLLSFIEIKWWISSLRCQLLDDVIAFKLINMMSAACFIIIYYTVQMSHSLSMCVSGKSDLLFAWSVLYLPCISLFGRTLLHIILYTWSPW